VAVVEAGHAAAGALDDVRRGEEESVGGDGDATAGAHRGSAAGAAAHLKIGDAVAQRLGDGDHRARVGIERRVGLFGETGRAVGDARGVLKGGDCAVLR
jgi:hypothetical protein